MLRSILLASAAICAAATVHAQNVSVDASAPVAKAATGYLKLGTAKAPDGTVLDINNQYLTVNGKPWMPVMGEIHFNRLPDREWDEELAKIKASGVDIVATYLFWNYHEETPGQFDWSGQRNLRKFVELAGRHGLKVIVRLGPWSHGEVRYGGVPDWVVHSLPTRGSDPTYMRYVDRYWGEIAKQVQGQLWKHGGPIIGIQLENEYNLKGPLMGREHIADLKKLALRHGFDVPFYTVTGWDGAVYPRREVVPVFGGYPDEPWLDSDKRLPPKETYAFRFDSRVSGNLGAQTKGAVGDADPDIPNTPFLGAEYGGGIPTMYRRRPIVTPDDIAAMLPVQLGSGVNLYGYYMYHGGSNLIGRTTLEENTAIGGYNDLPIIDYDFQAPFGAFGQTNPIAGAIRPFHYLMESYGALIAPTTVRKPATVPTSAEDLQTLRWSVRAKDDRAFVFVNNHVRQYRLPQHPGTQFTVTLRGGSVTFPSQPVTIPSDAYFVWPVGLDLGGQTLAWASAQPITRIDTPQGPVHFFAATDGIAPEFAFAPGTKVSGGTVSASGSTVVARVARPGTGALLTVTRPGAPSVRVVVLTQDQARHLWRTKVAGADRVILSDDQLVGAGDQLAFTSLGDSSFSFATWPALPAQARGSYKLAAAKQDGLFTRYVATAPSKTPTASLRQTRGAGEAPPIPRDLNRNIAVQPLPETFGRAAAAWDVVIPDGVLQGLDDAFLKIDWAGDIGRMFAGPNLIEDRFFDGRPWLIGLKRHQADLGKPLSVRVLPLRQDAPVYIDETVRPKLPVGGQVAEIRKLTLVPQYRLTVSFER